MIDPGTELGGKYRIVRLLGEGAMGAVYEAEHAVIARRVAVKVLHARYGGNEQALARFEREARAAGAVGHENIVDVFDFGTHCGLPFIVMELLKGETLSERLAGEGPLPARTACQVTGYILSALASTHASGIIHRDLKPENIFIVSRLGRDVIKLLDFGISKFRRTDGSERMMTHDGAIMGTPAYMAPEQWMGRRDIDHRADLFSVGVMLYEMLTGTLPYEGETQGELFLEIVKGTAPPPPPSEIVPGLPAALDAVVLRAIGRDRDARFQTGQDFLEALRTHGAEDIAAVAGMPAAPEADTGSNEPIRRRVAMPAATAVDVAPASDAAPLRAETPARARAVAAVVLAAVLGAGALWSARSGPAGRVATGARAADAIATATASAPATSDDTATRPPPDAVRVELRGLAPTATVTLDGARQPVPALWLPRGADARTLVVQVAGTQQLVSVRPDRDQLIVLDAPAAVAHATTTADARPVPTVPTVPAAAPARARARPPGPMPSARSHRRDGVGEMTIIEQF